MGNSVPLLCLAISDRTSDIVNVACLVPDSFIVHFQFSFTCSPVKVPGDSLILSGLTFKI